MQTLTSDRATLQAKYREAGVADTDLWAFDDDYEKWKALRIAGDPGPFWGGLRAAWEDNPGTEDAIRTIATRFEVRFNYEA